jgi:peptidyl-prolyl cis-trans isomerase C
MKELNRSTYLIILTVFLSACTQDEEVVEYPYDTAIAESSILATVGSDKIYRAELDHLLAFHSSDPHSSSAEGRQAVLDELINDQVMVKKAIENGFDQDPEFMNNQRKLLAYEYKKYLTKKIAKNTKITELDIELYYRENISQFTKPAMYRVAVYLRRNDIEKDHKHSLQQIAKSTEYLKPEQGFGQYSKTSNHVATQYRGGKLSWMTKNTNISGIPKSIFENIAKLKVGEVSSQISVENGQYLVRLIDQKSEQITPLIDVKADIRNKLISNAKQASLATYLSKAKESYKVEIYNDQLKTSKAKLSSEHSFGPPGFPAN